MNGFIGYVAKTCLYQGGKMFENFWKEHSSKDPQLKNNPIKETQQHRVPFVNATFASKSKKSNLLVYPAKCLPAARAACSCLSRSASRSFLSASKGSMPTALRQHSLSSSYTRHLLTPSQRPKLRNTDKNDYTTTKC